MFVFVCTVNGHVRSTVDGRKDKRENQKKKLEGEDPKEKRLCPVVEKGENTTEANATKIITTGVTRALLFCSGLYSAKGTEYEILSRRGKRKEEGVEGGW